MLLQASQIIGLPVAAADTQEKVGAVSSIVVDPDGGQLLGFTVKSGLFGGLKVLSFHDVVGMDHALVLVKNSNVILPPDEVAPVKKALTEKRPLLGQAVATESGTKLGKANDLVINTETGLAIKLYIAHFLEERIIPLEKIVRVTKREIIVKDDVVLGRGTATEIAPA